MQTVAVARMPRWIGAVSLALVLSAAWIAACSNRSAELPSPSPIDHVKLEVSSAGRITCNAFPYGCAARLSILPADAVVDFVVPPRNDLGWTPQAATGVPEGAEPALIGVIPAATGGRHVAVVTVTGSYDVASHAADGSLAFDLLSRCARVVELPASSIGAALIVTFDSDGASYGAPCSIEVKPARSVARPGR